MRNKTLLSGTAILTLSILLVVIISVTGTFGLLLTVALLSIGGLVLLYSIFKQLSNAIIKPTHRLYTKDFSLKFLATVMGLFLVSGALMYMFAFYTMSKDVVLSTELRHEVKFSNLEFLLRSLICSLDLFMLDVDSNLLDRLDSNTFIKGWISLQAVLSFSCTVAMLVSLAYSRIKSYYTLNYLTKVTNSRNHLYLFFGNNEPSELLIKDIIKNDPKALAIIIDEANVNEEDKDEWEGIVGVIAHKRNVFRTADKTGALVAIASQQLKDIDRDIADNVNFDAFGYLGLSKIKSLITDLSDTIDPQLHIFFLAEKEEDNILNIITLAKDSTIRNIDGKLPKDHRIYCRARYEGTNRMLEDVALKKNLNLHILDSSHMAVELLKSDPTTHPVNVVKHSARVPATIDSGFKSLIIGCDEVGMDAFRFLYEFGAFPSSDNPEKRAPFECIIADPEMEHKKGHFFATMPSIFAYNPETKTFESQGIELMNIEIGSSDFYSSIIFKDKFLEEVNYIVISLPDEDRAISLAAKLFSLIRKKRPVPSNLKILVRCADTTKAEAMQKIADHYNYGYGKGINNTPVIRIFGQPEHIYTFDLVVSDRLIRESKDFYERYRNLSKNGSPWDDRHKELAHTPVPNIDKLRKLRRQESQDRANALHAATKMIFLQTALRNIGININTTDEWESFYKRYFKTDGSPDVTGSKAKITYPGLSVRENEIILHLAMLEHLRWVAAHELLGYVYDPEPHCCDETAMTHNCLCPWGNLDAESGMSTDTDCDYKHYDFCVVDTTLTLHRQSL